MRLLLRPFLGQCDASRCFSVARQWSFAWMWISTLSVHCIVHHRYWLTVKTGLTRLVATALHDSAVVVIPTWMILQFRVKVWQCNYDKSLTDFLGIIMSSDNAIDGEPLTDVFEPQWALTMEWWWLPAQVFTESQVSCAIITTEFRG